MTTNTRPGRDTKETFMSANKRAKRRENLEADKERKKTSKFRDQKIKQDDKFNFPELDRVVGTTVADAALVGSGMKMAKGLGKAVKRRSQKIARSARANRRIAGKADQMRDPIRDQIFGDSFTARQAKARTAEFAKRDAAKLKLSGIKKRQKKTMAKKRRIPFETLALNSALIDGEE